MDDTGSLQQDPPICQAGSYKMLPHLTQPGAHRRRQTINSLLKTPQREDSPAQMAFIGS